PDGATATATLRVGVGQYPAGLPLARVAAANHDFVLREPAISNDGRYIAFATDEALVAADTNGTADVYVYDRDAAAFELVSVSATGAVANSSSIAPSISADGRYVAFMSAASNLVDGDDNQRWDIYVRDRVGKTTVRASIPSDATDKGDSIYPVI